MYLTIIPHSREEWKIQKLKFGEKKSKKIPNPVTALISERLAKS